MKRFFSLLLISAVFFGLVSVPVFAEPSSNQSVIKPDKVEYTTDSAGNIYPVFYFSDNTKALAFMKQRQQERQQDLAFSSNSVNSALANSVSYFGNVEYDFTNTFMANHTNATQTMSTTIQRQHTTTATATATAAFQKFFQLQIGVSYAYTYSYSHTFNLSVPANKKGLITTYNNTDVYNAAYSGVSFSVYRPTNIEGADIYIVDIDFPET
ncbi:hypothetical protein [Paenibacillus humicola]|uniref:hypothetical protein n=1 Tax=Paenibacillus humicola TaxID=3110540 RepID=UPI00237B52F7|nr:hypothetical protein [Paenibacillus humicola]